MSQVEVDSHKHMFKQHKHLWRQISPILHFFNKTLTVWGSPPPVSMIMLQG